MFDIAFEEPEGDRCTVSPKSDGQWTTTLFGMERDSAAVVDVKRMRLRFAGTCALCGTSLSAGITADYDRVSRTVACVSCPAHEVQPNQTDPTATRMAVDASLVDAATDPARRQSGAVDQSSLGVVDGHGGASAAAEYQRRHDARRERVLSNHPRMGRFLLAVLDDPQSTRAWSVGAEGERMLSDMLASMAGDSLRVLHDRRIPHTRANIDHLVVCPAGVVVVDAKRYRNSRPRLRVEGGLIRPRTELLMVAGRNRTALVTGMQRQVALVRAALADRPEVPVRGVLCFIDADWPVIGGSFAVNDVAVVWPKKLKALLTEPGPLDEGQIADLQWQLHKVFPRSQ